MSLIQIDPNPDLRKLREAGYNIRISSSGFLLVRDVPYVTSKQQIARGTLATNLDLAGDLTVQPKDHTIKFYGEYPCDKDGKPLEGLRHSDQACPVGDDIVTTFSFSRKPGTGFYTDYFEKITTYVALLEKHAVEIDETVTSRTRIVLEPVDDDSVFNYIDSASGRYEINNSTSKLEESALAIVGVGGTGSYVLDLLCKTPIKNLHIFDGGFFLTHNAFRSPGAPSLQELREQQFKVIYFQKIYEKMRKKIFAHPINVDEKNIELLKDMSFVFLCIDKAESKKLIISKLESWGIPFIDVGMGLYSRKGQIGGSLRSVLSLKENREIARSRISLAEDNELNEYDKNIQVAELNSLNACLAVLMWKKYRQFYSDLSKEKFLSFTIPNSLFTKDDFFEEN